jgi:hypothetical protein
MVEIPLYSREGILDLLRKHGGVMHITDLYRAIDQSGELTDYDRAYDGHGKRHGQIRFHHFIQAHLSKLKQDGLAGNPQQGYWRAVPPRKDV